MKAALIGAGIAGSLTPEMHEAEGRALGLDYRYDRIDTAADRWRDWSLDAVLDWGEGKGYAGLNITYPHKKAVVPLLDRVHGAAAVLGAVNTVVFGATGREGYTTDPSGFTAALSKLPSLAPGASVVQFGAGGAGRATALALLEAGAQVTLIDPAPGQATGAAALLNAVRPGSARAKTSPDDLDWRAVAGAVNATSIGMAARPGMAFDPADLPESAWVVDIVYVPLQTELVVRAKTLGRTVITGQTMAVRQAVGAFELITGHRPDPTRMARSFETILSTRPSAGR
ncbi:MAG: shikimate dehydrogenase [Paracoccaceae bacterium]|nr:shikimate dehydrogenase [Paracoccaceae bacterium]